MTGKPISINGNKSQDSAPCKDDPIPEKTGLTLEEIMTRTGELEHLNELVLLHIERTGGFTTTAAYFIQITPILDKLECEIRNRTREGITQDEMKEIIHAWIDRELSGIS